VVTDPQTNRTDYNTLCHSLLAHSVKCHCPLHFVYMLRTDPGKVWKVIEFKVEIFQVWKIMENDLRYGKVMESVTADLEN